MAGAWTIPDLRVLGMRLTSPTKLATNQIGWTATDVRRCRDLSHPAIIPSPTPTLRGLSQLLHGAFATPTDKERDHRDHHLQCGYGRNGRIYVLHRSAILDRVLDSGRSAKLGACSSDGCLPTIE